MEYREIVAVTGLSGLYQLMATKSDGAIVRNLEDKTTKFISARLHNVTPLESIEIYTTGDNVRLHNVLQKMKDSEASTPIADPKKADNNGIKAYFQSIFPELDEERVYVSDMKKMLKWYGLLKANDMLNFDTAQETTEETTAEETTETPKASKKNATEEAAEATEKPVKKAAAKKAAADGEEKPAKKTATKKAAADGEEKPAKKTAAKKKKDDE